MYKKTTKKVIKIKNQFLTNENKLFSLKSIMRTTSEFTLPFIVNMLCENELVLDFNFSAVVKNCRA